MPQFFINAENIQKDNILITNKSDIGHITNVLRYNENDIITLTGPQEFIYQAKILEMTKDFIKTQIIDAYKSNRKLNINITLAQSILKSQKQDFVIQKATELGVNTIIPVISQNTVVKFNTQKEKEQKIQRWQKIVYESVKQCKRVNIPEISNIISINELIELNNFSIKIACVERDAQFTIKELLSGNKAASSGNILMIIGPEGGWDNKELQLFKENNISLVSLGNLILRAETAATVAISNIIYEYEL